MSPLTTILTLLLSTTTTLTTASPLSLLLLRRSPTIVPQGHQSCTATDEINAVTYTTIIGFPYTTSLCPIIMNLMNSALGIPEQEALSGEGVLWSDCISHDKGRNFKLVFEHEHNHAKEINGALGRAFPGIGFNCPDY